MLCADSVRPALRRRLFALCLLGACAHDVPASAPAGRDYTSEARPDTREPVRVRPMREPVPGAPPRKLPPPKPLLSAKLSREARPRIVALGDLHGDLDATRRALRLAGAIDAADHWSGGELTLVQTGDVLDRGDDDRALEDLLARLREEAEAAGGEVIVLAGNHELMNTMLSFSYVTAGGYAAFGGESGRAAAFRPGGPYAALLATQPILIKVGNNVFVHGGILPEHIRYGLDRMNDELSSFMRGELQSPPEVLLEGNGLLWTRLYSNVPDRADCPGLATTLAQLGAKRMVVGHTPQLSGITSACDGQVLRIDTGMSRYYGGPVQALEIQGDALRVLKEHEAPALPIAVP